ncbi:hypothetical protein SAY87_014829 [Trapa incisa]|nr:hypothetical protein SAY87_014829 [Trapa incisa]
MECDRRGYVAARSIEMFNVSTMKFDPDTWRKAPRRQCCEVINGGDGDGGISNVLQVQIRPCNSWESVTPPW